MHLGERVGALYSLTSTIARLYGYGRYEGYKTPPKDAQGSLVIQLAEHGIPDHQIVLDNGTILWGCQCRWALESEVRKKISGKKVIMVELGKENAHDTKPKQVPKRPAPK